MCDATRITLTSKSINYSLKSFFGNLKNKHDHLDQKTSLPH
jgi:hypothetical protein